MSTSNKSLYQVAATNEGETVYNHRLFLPTRLKFVITVNLFMYRYYPALKTLEQLEHIHLPSISHYRFHEHMKKNLSKVRESIKEASMSDLKDFLESIRKYSPKIGEVAMRHVSIFYSFFFFI